MPADPTPTPKPRAARKLLVRRAGAAAACSMSEAAWDRATSAGLTPAPRKVGGVLLWSRAELAMWAASGCPPRKEWAALWSAHLTARRSRR